MHFLELAAAALLAQAAAAAPAATPGAQPPIRVEAPEASWDASGGVLQLRGGLRLQRGALLLRAPEGRYVPATGQVEVTGGALLVDGARAVVARTLRGEVGGVYELEDPQVFFAADADALAEARTPDEAERAARRRLTLRAGRATGRADGGIELSDARITLCDCGGGRPPTWELRTSRADVRPGERAVLTWPVLWITPRFLFIERPVPVLAFPWLWIPLGERQSGLLLPELRSTAASGPMVVEPLFVTLGRSADATLWGGYAFGPARSHVREGMPSVRGPMAALELRWRPAERSEGHVRLDWLDDLDAEPSGTHGARVALRGVHSQRLGARSDLRVDLDLVGDPFYVRDFTADLLQRDATYRRSAFLLSHRFDDAVVEESGSWLLPLAADASLAGVPGLSYGTFGASLPTFHRGPAVAARWLPTPVGGGLLASGRAEVARFGPFSGVTSDGGADGLGPGDRGWVKTSADAGQLDGRFEPGERLAATRAALRAELGAPFLVGRALRVAPFVRGAANGYAFDAAVDPLANAWGTAGATVESELVRRYGELRHAIVPRLAWRAGTGVEGRALPAFAYDAWDRAGEVPPGADAGFAGPRLLSAAPGGWFHQGRASVETRLDGPASSLARLEVGQDVDLRTGDLAESFATLRSALGPFSADGAVRWAGLASRPGTPGAPGRKLDDWTEVRGTLRLQLRPGADLHGGIHSLGAGGSPSVLAGADALFDLRPTALASTALVNAGVRLPLGPAAVGYDVLMPPRQAEVAACTSPGATRTLGGGQVQQQTGSLSWDSPCHCFRAAVVVHVDYCGNVSYQATIDLSPKEPLGALK